MGPIPRIQRDDHPNAEENIEDEVEQIRGDVDSDWAHRKHV